MLKPAIVTLPAYSLACSSSNYDRSIDAASTAKERTGKAVVGEGLQSAARSRKPPRAGNMLSGRRLDLLDPSPLDIEIEDIAHGLARVARWNGQTLGDQGFSVAQHSLVVEEIAAHIDPSLEPRWR